MTVFGLNVWWPLAFVALMLAGGMVLAWMVQEWAPREDVDVDEDYFGAVTGGDTLSRRSLKEIGRRMALDSHKATTNAVIKSIRRHGRRHGGAR